MTGTGYSSIIIDLVINVNSNTYRRDNSVGFRLTNQIGHNNEEESQTGSVDKVGIYREMRVVALWVTRRS